jgi:hypothetical protein
VALVGEPFGRPWRGRPNEVTRDRLDGVDYADMGMDGEPAGAKAIPGSVGGSAPLPGSAASPRP